MAISTDTIRRITVTADGKPSVDALSASLDKLAVSHNKVATAAAPLAAVTDASAKKQLSAEQAYRRQTLAIDDNARMQDVVAKKVAVATAAFNQGILGDVNSADAKAALSKRISEINNKYGEASVAAKAYATATSGVSGQLIALSAGAGPVGVFLSALGPWGIAAAAGLGVASAAFDKATEATEKLTQKTEMLERFQRTTGFASDQIQALSKVASRYGVDTEAVTGAVQKFTISWEGLRRGGGDLLEEINRINPGLALQMQRANDAADAFDLLAKAWREADRAGDTGSRNALARAAGGRGGISAFSAIFSQLGQSGGLGGLAAAYAPSNIPQETIDRINKIKRETEALKKQTDGIWGRMFAEDVLEQQRRSAEFWNSIATAMERVSKSRAELGNAPTISDIPMPPGYEAPSSGRRMSDAEQQAMARRDALAAFRRSELQGYDNRGLAPLTSDAQFNREQTRVSALGSAATASEKLALKQLELNAAVDKGAITQETYNRALGAARQDVQISALSSRISLLGDLATTSDIVLAKQLEINRANLAGAKITETESAAIKEKTRLQAEYSKLPNQLAFEREQIGRSDIDATVAARLRGAGIDPASDAGRLNAELIRTNEQLRIGKELTLDFASGFARDMRNGVSATEALGNALQRVGDRLMDMALNSLISSAFGAASGGGGLGALFGFLKHDGGIVGGAGPGRYVHPAYFDDAPRYHGGGIAGDEVPIIAQRGEEVLRRDDPRHRYNGGGGAKQTTNNNYVINAPGATREAMAYALGEINKLKASDAQRGKSAVAAYGVARDLNPAAVRP